jgi:hypothetical protein
MSDFTYLGGTLVRATGSIASLAITSPVSVSAGDLVFVASAAFMNTSGSTATITDNLGNTWETLGQASWITAARNLTLFSSIITNGGTLTATIKPSTGNFQPSVLIDAFSVTSGFTISLDGSVLSGNSPNADTSPAQVGTLTPSGTDVFYAVAGMDGTTTTTWTGNGTITSSGPGQSGENDSIAAEYFLNQTSAIEPTLTPAPEGNWGMVVAAFVATPTTVIVNGSASLNGSSSFTANGSVSVPGLWNLVQRATATSGSSAVDTQPVSFTNPVTANNFIVVKAINNASNPNSSVTDSEVNEYQTAFNENNANGNASIFVAQAATSGTLTVTLQLPIGGALCSIEISEYSGPPNLSVDTATGLTGSGTALATSSITTTSDDLIVAVANAISSPQTWTAGSGFSLGFNNAGSSGVPAIACEDMLNATAGSYTPAFTDTTSGAWLMAAAAFRQAPTLGVANLAITSSFSANGVVHSPQLGMANLVATSCLSANGVGIHTGISSLVETSSLSAVGVVGLQLGSASLVSNSSFTSSGIVFHSADASLSSSTTVTARGNVHYHGSASLVTDSSISPNASVKHTGKSGLTVNSSLSASPVVIRGAVTRLVVGSTLTSTGSVQHVGVSSLVGTSSCDAVGEVEHSGKAALAVNSSFTAVPKRITHASSSLVVTTSLAGNGSPIHGARAALVTSSSMVGSGSVLHGATAALEVTSSLVGATSVKHTGRSALAVNSSLVTGAAGMKSGVARLVVGSTFASLGSVHHVGASSLVGSSSFTSNTTVIRTGRATMIMNSLLQASTATLPKEAAAALIVSSALSARTQIIHTATAALIVGSSLNASPNRTAQSSCSMIVDSSLTATYNQITSILFPYSKATQTTPDYRFASAARNQV